MRWISSELPITRPPQSAVRNPDFESNRDPIAEQGGFNLYGYVMNDPINGRDYLGLCDIYTLPDFIVDGNAQDEDWYEENWKDFFEDLIKLAPYLDRVTFATHAAVTYYEDKHGVPFNFRDNGYKFFGDQISATEMQDRVRGIFDGAAPFRFNQIRCEPIITNVGRSYDRISMGVPDVIAKTRDGP